MCKFDIQKEIQKPGGVSLESYKLDNVAAYFMRGKIKEINDCKLKVSSTVQFLKEWENVYFWVTNDASGNPEMAFCKVCCETLPAQKLKLAFHHKSMNHRKNQVKKPINYEKARRKGGVAL